MTLRRKLLVAQLPLVIALALIAAGALVASARFGAAPGEILYENFRSFDASTNMLQVVDRLDQRIAPGASQRVSAGETDVGSLLAAFDRELRLQESNITEPGEKETTHRLRGAWERYQTGLKEPMALEQLEIQRERSRELRDVLKAILETNRDAMRNKSNRAATEAARIGSSFAAAAVIAFLLALAVSGLWLRRIVGPVRVLDRAVERLSAGDFDARIRVQGDDEIASLANSFNKMADHLARYRSSSVGELIDANNRLESVMHSLADAVVVYDLDGEPFAHNQAATQLFGQEGLRMEALPEPLKEPVSAAFEQVQRTGEPLDAPPLETAIELPGGTSPRWLLVSATPVRSRAEALSGVTVAIRDVTRSRRIEGFKGDLVAAAAHELRTPLTSLHMAVHLCLEQAAGPLTERQDDLLTTARQDCERLQTIVEELLEMARLESGAARLDRSKVSLSELVRNALVRHQAHASQLGKTVTVVAGDALLSVDADAARLSHVLDNLINNALLHSGGGSRIDIGFERQGESVKVYIDDAGPGVPQEMQEQVFAKFFRMPGTEKSGSGLGLSIVHDIVRAHGGEVGVQPSPLGGARFWFSIPCRITPGQSHGLPSPSSASS